MTAYRAGDRAAFDQLFERLAPRVHAFFVRAFGDRALADDLMQTTFLKVHRARQDFRVGSAVRPWLFAIAARLRTDEWRRRQARPEVSDIVGSGDDERRIEGTDPAPTPAAAAERRSSDERVQEAIARLPESQRMVLHLHNQEGLSFPEIAAILETTEGAVKLRAFRAYERLREELRDLLESEVAA